MLLAKKLAENVIFDDDVVPTSYTCIDGSDKTATETAIPLSLVFSVTADMLEEMSKLLDMSNTTIVKEVIDKLKLDEKMVCFKNTFNFLELIDSQK
jgi:hypothetical protein